MSTQLNMMSPTQLDLNVKASKRVDLQEKELAALTDITWRKIVNRARLDTLTPDEMRKLITICISESCPGAEHHTGDIYQAIRKNYL